MSDVMKKVVKALGFRGSDWREEARQDALLVKRYLRAMGEQAMFKTGTEG